LNYISLCSGIEAASLAFSPLGWQPIAFSEIEPFPCQVLAHHYLTVPNLGDMADYRQWPEELLSNCDLVVGGCPCQSFSVAGLRNSLDDERGNLTLVFVHLINYIDTLREQYGKPPVVILYENVPGLFSAHSNPFGCLVGALCGQDDAVEIETGKWPNAGVLWGKARRVGWRILDAQFFGLAQRRRRVFVVAVPNQLVGNFGDAACPSEILAIPESLRGDTPPRRKTREEVAGATAAGAGAGGGLGDGLGVTVGALQALDYKGVGNQYVAEGKLVVQSANIYGGNKRKDRPEGGFYVKQNEEFSKTLDAATGLNPTCSQGGTLVYSLQGNMLGRQEHNGPAGKGFDESGACYTLTGADVYGVVYGIPGNWIGRKPENGGNATAPMVNVAPNLTATDRHGVCYGLDDEVNGSVESIGCMKSRMKAGGGVYSVAFSAGNSSGSRSIGYGEEVTPPLRSAASGTNRTPTVAYAFEPGIAKREGNPNRFSEEVSGTLRSEMGDNQTAVAFTQNTRDEVRYINGDGQLAGALAAQPGMKQTNYIKTPSVIRRLTPVEAARLQGFPDDYLDIPFRGKPATDSVKYKALGNSMAVPVMAWIGRQISRAFRPLFTENDDWA